MTQNLLTFDSRDAWLVGRYDGIGGSDAPSIFGHGYKSRVDLFMEKVYRESTFQETEAMRWGNRHEAAIRAALREDHGFVIEEDPKFSMRVHRDYPWMRASLDGRIIDPKKETQGVLQIKTAGGQFAKEWESLEGGMPLGYQIQIQHEMNVFGTTWGVLAVLFGGNNLKLIDVVRHEKFVNHMVMKEGEFWRAVQERELMEDANTEEIARWWTKNIDGVKNQSIELPRDFLDIRQRLKVNAEEIKRLEDEKTMLTNEAKRLLGEYEEGTVDGLRVTFKVVEKKEYTVAPKKYRELRWFDPKGEK